VVAFAVLVSGCGTTHVRTATIVGPSAWAAGFVGARPPVDAVTVGRRVAAQNSLVQRLIGPRATMTESFVWLGSAHRPAVIELAFALRHVRAIDAVVPFAVNPPDAPATGDCRTPYAPGYERLQAQRVRNVFVGVDVRLRRVVDIGTDAPRSIVSAVPGRPFPICEEKQT
jgi:hypothetical protein